MDNIVETRTQCEFGPFLSFFDENGNFDLNISEPKFSTVKYIKGKKTLKRSVVFNIKNLPSNSLKIVWIHIPLPRQATQSEIQKIFYSQGSGLDILKNLSISNGLITTSFTRQEYKLFLQRKLGNEKFETLHKKYFDLQNNVDYKNRLKYNQNQEIDSHVIHLPILFNPKSILNNNNIVNIEISFSAITKLFTFTKNVELNELNLDEVNATVVHEMKNDQNYFIENDKSNYEQELAYFTHNLEYSKEYTVKDNFLGQSVTFTTIDCSFGKNESFYGKTIYESIKCYLNSCFKPKSDSDTCINLKTLKLSDQNTRCMYSTSKIDCNRIQLTYKNNEDEYNTLIYSPNIKFEDVEIFIDVSVSKRIHLFWFKYIELDMCRFDKNKHKLDKSITSHNATKIINGLFNIKGMNNVCMAVLGTTNFELNYKIKITNSIFPIKSGEKRFLTQKHYDVFFSLPVFKKNHSFFSECDFVCMDLSDWRWMDLEKKYEWSIDSITVSDADDPSHQKIYNHNSLVTLNNGEFDNWRIDFTPKYGLTKNKNNNNGYFVLTNLKFKIEDNSNDDFNHIKKEYSKLIRRKAFISHIEVRNKKTMHKIDINSLQKLSNSESCLELLDQSGYKRLKINN